MMTIPRNSYAGDDARTQKLAKTGFAREEPVIAHMKVIAPLTSTGPSIRARIVKDSASLLIVRYPDVVFAGALVQIRIQSRVLFGKALRCIATGSEYEIEIEKQEIYGAGFFNPLSSVLG